MAKNKHHSSNKLDDHLSQSVEVQMDGNKYDVVEGEVHSDPILDKGVGRGIILRQFEYALNPNLPRDIKISKQDIFNSHQKQIEMMLWADGLVPLNEIHKTKVQISKSQKKYRIFVLCQPRQGVALSETPTKIK